MTMRYFAVITTRNSLYTVESAQSNQKLVRCVFGTFQGETWLLTPAQWNASSIKVGEPAHFVGACNTSTVGQFEEFYVPSLAERAEANGRLFNEPKAFVHAVVAEVDAIINPVAIYDV